MRHLSRTSNALFTLVMLGLVIYFTIMAISGADNTKSKLHDRDKHSIEIIEEFTK